MKRKMSPEEVRKYAQLVMDNVFRGQSIAATLIAVGITMLSDFLNQPNRMDLFGLGASMILAGYVFNYIRARKKIENGVQ